MVLHICYPFLTISIGLPAVSFIFYLHTSRFYTFLFAFIFSTYEKLCVRTNLQLKIFRSSCPEVFCKKTLCFCLKNSLLYQINCFKFPLRSPGDHFKTALLFLISTFYYNKSFSVISISNAFSLSFSVYLLVKESLF